ncbi:MAG: hypothetical protein ACTSRS_12715 [Candidatus Helarchaeota archaeon]
MNDIFIWVVDPFYLIQAIILSIFLIPLSWWQYKLARGHHETQNAAKLGWQVLKFRFSAGVCMGLFDHCLMILGGFHPGIWPLGLWYVIVVYITMVLLIPSNLKRELRLKFLILWLIGVISLSSIIEIMFHYVTGLPYPAGWTELTTILFYFTVYLFGAFLATLHWHPYFSEESK